MKNHLYITILFLLLFYNEANIKITNFGEGICSSSLNIFDIEAESEEFHEKDFNISFNIKGENNDYLVLCSIEGKGNDIEENETNNVENTETSETHTYDTNTNDIETNDIEPSETNTEKNETLTTDTIEKDTETNEINPTDIEKNETNVTDLETNDSETNEINPTDIVKNDTNITDIETNDSNETNHISLIYRLRYLEKKNYKGKCEIKNVKESEEISNDNIVRNPNVEFVDNFKINLIKCSKDENILISFRQLCGFKYLNEMIIFIFYGMIPKNIKKGHQILMDVNLIKNGTEEPETDTKTAICILQEDVNGESNPKQGNFSCTIQNIINKIYYTFVFKSSENLERIPEDKILLNPYLTDKYIALGKIIDRSTNIKNAPIFNSTFINYSSCNDNGKFGIVGALLSDLNYDINFPLTLSNPKNVTATCFISSGKMNDTKTIECQTNNRINNEKIIIAQNTILDIDKSELLSINKIESSTAATCSNGKIAYIIKKIEKPILISFRQLNQFVPSNKGASFNFIGISNSTLPEDSKIKMLVYVIYNGIKTQKEITCNLISFKSFNIRNLNYGQAEYKCEVEYSNKPEDIEIISSDEILGINDDLEDFQKSPNKTDIKIIETKNEPNLGKVLNYSEITYGFPPMLEISNIDVKNADKGKIKVTGKFNKKIDKKFDFKIPLSYPLSSLKCKAPKTQENKVITMKCKIQKQINNVDYILIEPKILRKKYQEVIFVDKFNGTLSEMNWTNYNDLQKEDEKYSLPYTFIKTNNFIPYNKGFFFRLFLYALNTKRFEETPTIPITFHYKKKSNNLRNLEESEEEEEQIECLLNYTEERVGIYNCTDGKLNINDLDLEEEPYLDSNDFSGSNPDNSNPIGNNDTNSSIPTIYEFNTENIDSNGCENKGEFSITGKLDENSIFEKIKNIEVYYSNPPDSKGICNITSLSKIECHNQDDFEEEFLRINNQPLGSFSSETIILKQINSTETLSCAISSKSLDLEIAEPIVGNTTNTTDGINNYYIKKDPSRGLTGGAIAAIVIISALTVIGVGVLAVLIKNGVIGSPKPEYYSKAIPQLSRSSGVIV